MNELPTSKILFCLIYAMRNEIILIFGSFISFGFEFHCGMTLWIVPPINEMDAHQKTANESQTDIFENRKLS